MSDVLLQVSGLSKTFTLHQTGTTLRSLVDCSFTAHPGALTALTGPSGAGKSTVLKCIHRTYLPGSGSIHYGSRRGMVDLVTADEATILDLRRQEIGFVTQFLHVLPRQGARDVVAAPLRARGVPLAEARAAAAEALAGLALPERLWELPPATFSGGEQQRVNLARTLAAKPRLLLLDEPTASLDRASAELVEAAIERAKGEGIAMVAIFHDPELVRRVADHVVTLRAPG
jgi:alpha-D-ribose 1-methylphosphonate 5-triphosphate synthase subunit PhnL